MAWDYDDYSGNADTPALPLLLSERSRQLFLAAIEEMDNRSNWNTDDSQWDEIEAALGESYDEIMSEIMPDFTPVGSIVAWAGTIATIPEKWQICDGHLLDVDDYPDLRAALDIPFDDNTFLTVPDLRDRFIYGMGTGSTLGAIGGAATVALAINEIPAHDHIIGTSSGQGGRLDRVQRGDLTSLNTQTTSSVGVGAAHQNLPPYMRLFYIMKVLP